MLLVQVQVLVALVVLVLCVRTHAHVLQQQSHHFHEASLRGNSERVLLLQPSAAAAAARETTTGRRQRLGRKQQLAHLHVAGPRGSEQRDQRAAAARVVHVGFEGQEQPSATGAAFLWRWLW